MTGHSQLIQSHRRICRSPFYLQTRRRRCQPCRKVSHEIIAQGCRLRLHPSQIIQQPAGIRRNLTPSSSHRQPRSRKNRNDELELFPASRTTGKPDHPRNTLPISHVGQSQTSYNPSTQNGSEPSRQRNPGGDSASPDTATRRKTASPPLPPKNKDRRHATVTAWAPSRAGNASTPSHPLGRLQGTCPNFEWPGRVISMQVSPPQIMAEGTMPKMCRRAAFPDGNLEMLTTC